VTIVGLVASLRERLRGAVESPALEAELLVAKALRCERAELLGRDRSPASDAVVAEALALAERRQRGEPIAWLIGGREFHGRRFQVGPGVLVPRPETEHLVDVALAAAPRGLWADVGTGCGAVGITLLLERRAPLRCLAIDLSPQAIACARRNAIELGADERDLVLVQGDLLSPVAPGPRLDGIVSNPPYVEPHEWPLLPPEIQWFEPQLALTPGCESAAAFRGRLIAQAVERLKPGGFLAIEVGAGQAGVARDQLLAAGLRRVAITNDLAAIGRVVSAFTPGATG